MTPIELILLSVALAMDAFAVSICTGLSLKEVTVKKYVVVGGYFGFFQGAMPVLGFLVAGFFAEAIVAYDHWIAFGLLAFLGGKMIWGAMKKNEDSELGDPALTFAFMLPLALATSIDALAVGVSFVALNVSIVPAVLLIGFTSFFISIAGVRIGHVFGLKYKKVAEIAGGIILILIGVRILVEHLLFN